MGTRPPLPIALGAALVAIALPACAEVQSGSTGGYEPAHVDADTHLVTLTGEGARRTGLRTAVARRSGDRIVVPYAALIYDGSGVPHVYTMREPLSFQRFEVRVGRIAGQRALLEEGPRPGTRVVTTGAAEVYGAELGIDGGH